MTHQQHRKQKKKRGTGKTILQAGLLLALCLMIGGYFLLPSLLSATYTAEAPAEAEDTCGETWAAAPEQVTELTETLRETIPYETHSYYDDSLEDGETLCQTAGILGEKEITQKKTYVNGVLTGTEIIGVKMITEPVDEVILMGTQKPLTLNEAEIVLEVYQEPEPEPSETRKPQTSTSSAGSAGSQTYTAPSAAPASTTAAPAGNTVTTASGEVISYSKVLSVTATAYSGGGTTATGTAARYGAIAVDPSVIPYGTKMYIVSDDGKWIYGYATAEDCGGAIKGNIIDLYFDSENTCIQFGRRACTVYILD